MFTQSVEEKKAVARVYLTEGSGAIVINGKDVKEYFTVATLQYKLEQAQALAGVEGQYDINVNVVVVELQVKQKQFVWGSHVL